MATGYINFPTTGGGVTGLTVTANDVLAGKIFTRDGINTELGTYVPTLKTEIISISGRYVSLNDGDELTVAYLPKGNILSIEVIDRDSFATSSYEGLIYVRLSETGGYITGTIGKIETIFKISNNNIDLELFGFGGGYKSPVMGVSKEVSVMDLKSISLLTNSKTSSYKYSIYTFKGEEYGNDNGKNVTRDIERISNENKIKLASSSCRLYMKVKRNIISDPEDIDNYGHYSDRVPTYRYIEIHDCKLKVMYI